MRGSRLAWGQTQVHCFELIGSEFQQKDTENNKEEMSMLLAVEAVVLYAGQFVTLKQNDKSIKPLIGRVIVCSS